MSTGVVRMKDPFSSCFLPELPGNFRELCKHIGTVLVGIGFLSFLEEVDSVKPIAIPCNRHYQFFRAGHMALLTFGYLVSRGRICLKFTETVSRGGL
jgi:hypothetical protein